MGMVLFWIAIVLCFACIGLFLYRFIKFERARDIKSLNKKNIIEFLIYILSFGVLVIVASYGIVLWNNYPLDGLHHFLLIAGSLIFGISLFTIFECFVFNFYKTDLIKEQRKWIKRSMFISIPLAVIFFVVTVESYACYMPLEAFPLINGMNISGEGIKFTTATKHGSGGFTIAWYGLIILSGAVIAYFVSDHHFYQEYHRHGIIDTLFIAVFLIGIVGARFWYCAVLEHRIDTFFNFQDGGLAIMGGVIFGGTAGILFLALFRRYINIRHAIDLILPCVLIAQAIGRWGNFFNQEVYGAMSFEYESVWWLPSFIKNQMTVAGMVHLPLFLIEFITNLSGYFIIHYAIGKGLKKRLSYGDLFCLYIVWYGLTRVILEPLRESTYEYGASWITAWCMFGGGILAIIILHLYDYLRWGKYTFKLSKMSDKHKIKYFHKKYIRNSDESTIKEIYSHYNFIFKFKSKQIEKKLSEAKIDYKLENDIVMSSNIAYINRKNPYFKNIESINIKNEPIKN